MTRFYIVAFLFFGYLSTVLGQKNSDSASTVTSNFPFFEELLSKEYGGAITITQDPKIAALIEKHTRMNRADNKIPGWRIQIYNSSGKEARDEANEFRNKFLAKYPEMRAYVVYQPPYFKIRVGDFLTKQDAFRLYKDVLKEFPVSYLVPDKINYPQL